MSQPHPIFYPVEAAAAELDTVVSVPFLKLHKRGKVKMRLPLQLTRSCEWGSLRVLAVTPSDAPVRCAARVAKGQLFVTAEAWPAKCRTWPTFISVHLVGRARTSPAPWHEHSRQEYQSNRRAFDRAHPAP